MSKKTKKKAQKAKAESLPSKHSFLKIISTFILAAALTSVILLNIFTHVFSVVQYYGDSMEPEISDRQILIVKKTDKVSNGDISAFYYNNKVLVRRVIASGGAIVDIDSTGKVFVDGNLLSEPYVESPALGQSNVSFPFTVPYEEFFVMGDNRAVSMDSRLKELGTVPRNRMIGKVVLVFG